MSKVILKSDSLVCQYDYGDSGNIYTKRACHILAAPGVTAEDIVDEYKKIGRSIVGDEGSSELLKNVNPKNICQNPKEFRIMETTCGENDHIIANLVFGAFEKIADDMFDGAKGLAEYLVKERDKPIKPGKLETDFTGKIKIPGAYSNGNISNFSIEGKVVEFDKPDAHGNTYIKEGMIDYASIRPVGLKHEKPESIKVLGVDGIPEDSFTLARQMACWGKPVKNDDWEDCMLSQIHNLAFPKKDDENSE